MKKVKFLKLLLFVGIFVMVVSTLFINDTTDQELIEQSTYIQMFGLSLILPYIFHHE